MKIHSGLASVTFRNKQPHEIIAIASRAGLEGIEWGGDIHLPPAESFRAEEVGNRTRQADLNPVSYGSYLRVGELQNITEESEAVLSTAALLGAARVRVWAGKKGSREVDSTYWQRVVEQLGIVGCAAQNKGLLITLEFHSNTLTDSAESAVKLIRAVNHPSVKLTWQRPVDVSDDVAFASLEKVMPWLVGLHVFWLQDHRRCPLKEGRGFWEKCFDMVRRLNRVEALWAFLEFVKDESEDQFIEDSEVLKSLVGVSRS